MHFHLPKPVHGWRELLGEVGIIVIGVLIALAAEQTIELLHERHVAGEARSNVRAEARRNLTLIRERLQRQSCIDRRVAELSRLLARTGAGVLDSQPLWISRPPTGPFFFGRWEAATASGRNSLFSAEEQDRFGQVYAVFRRFDAYQTREQAIWSDLRALEGWQGPLGPEARLAFARDLQEARYLAWDLHYAGTFAMRNGHAMGLADAPLDNRQAAICLPLTTPRATALQRLGDPFGEP